MDAHADADAADVGTRLRMEQARDRQSDRRVAEPRELPALTLDRPRLLEVGLLALRAGPFLILLILIVVVVATTPVFRTSENLGNVLSQTSVISILALGQLLVIVTRGID